MQLVPRYLLSNIITLVINKAGFTTEFRPVYARQLQIYKGIDNVVQFRLMNADQRPVSTSQYVPRFVAFDQTDRMIFDKIGTVLDDGSSSTKGLFSVTLSEEDLLSVEQQYLKYNVYLVNLNNDRVLTYSHSNFDNDAIIYISSDAFPGPKDSVTIDTFNKLSRNEDIWYSETAGVNTVLATQNDLHSIAIYANDYVGNITVQATLDNSVTEGTDWADIATLTLEGTESEPVALNLTGAYMYIRFKLDSDPLDKISKILVRS